MLHGLPSHHTDAMPTCGIESRSFDTPQGTSIACAPAPTEPSSSR